MISLLAKTSTATTPINKSEANRIKYKPPALERVSVIFKTAPTLSTIPFTVAYKNNPAIPVTTPATHVALRFFK